MNIKLWDKIFINNTTRERRWKKIIPERKRVYLRENQAKSIWLVTDGGILLTERGKEILCRRDEKGDWYFEK